MKEQTTLGYTISTDVVSSSEQFTKPQKLKVGDKIAVVALSSCGGFLFPHRLENGIAALKTLGFSIQEYPCVRKCFRGSAGAPEERAQDLNEAFADNEVRAIVAAIGGLSANEVIGLLDYDLISKHPKIFCGYSDNTLLHCALAAKAKLISFYGPCLLTQFGEHPVPLQYTVDSFLKTLTQGGNTHITPSDHWTDECLDWFEKSDLSRKRNLKRSNDAHKWLHAGKAIAPIVGGCLSSLLQVKGTEFDFDYDGKIVFLDIPEGEDNFATGQSISYVSSQLADLKLVGVLSKIKGLVVGRGFGYSDEQQQELLDVISYQTRDFDIPILANVNIGHTDPIITLPLNVMVSLNSQTNTFEVLESGVR